jgi:hypothetical protein
MFDRVESRRWGQQEPALAAMDQDIPGAAVKVHRRATFCRAQVELHGARLNLRNARLHQCRLGHNVQQRGLGAEDALKDVRRRVGVLNTLGGTRTGTREKREEKMWKRNDGRHWRSWRSQAVCAGSLCRMCPAPLFFSLYLSLPLSFFFGKMVYHLCPETSPSA